MTLETCGIKGCGKTGNLGNTVRYVKVYETDVDGKMKRISLPMCTKCETELKERRRPWKS